MPCSIAQALEVVGEWWTLLIVRDLLMGVTRFDALQERLGIARNILTDRLATLVAAGVVEKHPYQTNPERFEYRLTEKGTDLWPVVTGLQEWGDRWAAPDGVPAHIVHRDCGQVTHVRQTCASCGEAISPDNVRLVPGPGAGDGSQLPPGARNRSPLP